jgi:hypothetical protein
MAKLKIERLILSIYKQRPEAVNDDALLIAIIWSHLGWDKEKSLYENIKNMPRPTSITRSRRTLHERGEIKYSPAIEDRRFKEYMECTAEYAKKSV